jgi:hypothetical protein
MYFDSIWKGRKDDDQMGFCGETEEEARQNTANYTQIPKKPFAPSPWKDARHDFMRDGIRWGGVSGM